MDEKEKTIIYAFLSGKNILSAMAAAGWKKYKMPVWGHKKTYTVIESLGRRVSLTMATPKRKLP